MTEYERVLFFDSDAIVMGDLGELVRSSETLYTIDDGLGGGSEKTQQILLNFRGGNDSCIDHGAF